jgi:hypothetical protein
MKILVIKEKSEQFVLIMRGNIPPIYSKNIA